MGYVEINPFVVVNKSVRVLDMAAKVDETGEKRKKNVKKE